MRHRVAYSPGVRILLVSIDTRGGVAPYGVLGDALACRGHEVVVAAPADLVDVLPGSVSVVPLPGGMREAVEALGSTEGVLRAPRGLRSTLQARTEAAVRAVLEAIGGVDVVVAGVGGAAVAEAVALAHGAPLLRAHLQPIGPAAAEYPGVLAPRLLQRAGVPRLLGHVATAELVTLPVRGTRRSARLAANVSPRARPRVVPGAVYGYSQRVVPRARSWAPDRVITGYWRSAETEPELEPALADFLDRHDRPVVVGFGSMRVRDPVRIAQVIRRATSDLGLPMVVLTGWNGPFPIQDLPETVFVAPEAPHDRLFRRASAVVHHGGAGTTGASLTAGVPTIVVPFAADQTFWGNRVHALGAGPGPIPVAGLTEQRLVNALEIATGTPVAHATATLAEQLQAEDGPGAAVTAIEHLLSGRTASPER